MKKLFESTIHKQICDYIRLQYPDVMFVTDLSGIKLTIGQAVKLKSLRSTRAWPDLFIAQPNKKYCGLFLEIKRDISELLRKDGITQKKNKHIEEQDDVLNRLRYLGYEAGFVCGFDDAKFRIDKYMKSV